MLEAENNSINTSSLVVVGAPMSVDSQFLFESMDFYLVVTNYVGSFSTIVNGLYVILILVSPPENLGIFRSQFYVGAFASFFFAATQLWTANVLYPNGTLFLMFSARGTGTVGFLLFAAASTLQFTMLSSNFAVRLAAIRGRANAYEPFFHILIVTLLSGWIREYLTNHVLFYGIQISCVLSAYIPPIVLLAPTLELRKIANATYGNSFNFDFMAEYYFVSSYDRPAMGNSLVTDSIYIMVVAFEGMNLLIMLGLCSFLFLFMPGMVINSSMLLRIDASSIAPMLCSLMTLGTLFNPLTDIVLTPDYQKRILHKLFPGDAGTIAGEITASTANTPSINKHRSPITLVRMR